MVREIRQEIINIAVIKGATCTYSQLNDIIGLGLDFENTSDRTLIGDWLDEVSKHEYKLGRPILSSLVLRKSGGKKYGDGFGKLIAELFGDSYNNSKHHELLKNECYEFWGDRNKYLKYKDDY